MAKTLKAKDTHLYIVGRYIQVLFDGHPDLQDLAIKSAKKSFDLLLVKCFRVHDFLNESRFHKRSLSLVSPVYDAENRDVAYYKTLNQILREDPSKL
jgi:hypothetical protein